MVVMRMKRESGSPLSYAGPACPLCGVRVASGTLFCPRCGRSGRLRFDPAGIRRERREACFPRRFPR